ncbi:NAD(P)-binding domain-containing protein [Nocardiopsis tropica]|nr:NAD(P)-binding domain-containing protein [Nocardiopsis tropica]
MGTAFARAWLAAGYPLTVWNRTPSRAEPLAAEGAEVAATAAEAASAPMVVPTSGMSAVTATTSARVRA